jgi:DNA repair protein SbcC/Rad50
MKILSIKGRNLASFEGDFEVDFTQGDLAETNLFAITGPTGSGKSTILDALCLGLFGKTPRLEKGVANISNKMQDISGEDIALNDPRQLLRRGTGEGYAEVTFVGVDKKTYQAQWKIRRAGDKSPGRFQGNQHFIRDIETGREQKIDSALTKIREILGLSYEQFCRSILLPQGGFSAFLEAKPEDRSPLLEVLTGTEIYSTISKNAFLKSTEYSTQIKNHKIQLEGIESLNEEELADLNLQKADFDKIEKELDTQKKSADDLQKWYAQLDVQTQGIVESKEEIGKSDKQVKDLEPLQAEVDLHEKSNQYKSEYISYNTKMSEVLEKEKALAEKRKLETEAKDRLEDAEAENKSLTSKFVALKEKTEQELKSIQKAKIEQNTLDSLATAHKNKSEETDSRKADLSKVTFELRESENLLSESKTLLDESNAIQKKAEEDGIEKLSQNWSLWNQKFPEAIKLKAEHSSLVEKQVEDEKAAADLSQNMQNQKDLLNPLQANEVELLEAQKTLKEELSKLNKNANQDLKAQEKLLIETEGSIKLLQAMGELKAKKTDTQSSFENNQSDLAKTQVAIKDLDVEIENKKVTLAALKVYFEINQDLEKTLEALRTSLEKDQDCPVCGSASHPLLEDDSYAEKQKQAKGSREKLQKEYDSLEESYRALQRQEAVFEAESKNLLKDLEDLKKELSKVLEQLNVRGVSTEKTSLENLEKQVSETQSLIGNLEVEIKKGEDLGLSLEKNQEALDICRQKLEALRTKLTAIEKEEIVAQTKVTQNKEDLEGQIVKIAEIKHAWEKEYQGLAIGDWQHFEKTPQLFYDKLATRISEFENHYKKLEKLNTQADSLRHQVEKFESAQKTAQDEVEKVQKQLEDALEKMKNQKQLRLGIYAAENLVEAEKNLHERLNEEDAKLKKHNDTLRNLITKSVTAVELLDEANKGLAAVQVQFRASENVLKSKIVSNKLAMDFETGLDILKVEFEKPQDWKVKCVEKIQSAKSALQKANTTLEEREKNLKSLTENKPKVEGVDSPALVLEFVQKLTEELEVNTQEKDKVTSKLNVDKANKERNQKTLAKIGEIEKEGSIWFDLNRMIGSSDGKVFRNIAQQYTLDLLVAQANKHLATLSKRYQLAREDDSLTLVIIDLNMGQARRPAHSLSGGESFLVSLGLALGLSGLSGQKASLESLFIDEGFGTLDPATLNVAMEALDALQAQGRKVGIITHVEGLRERIQTQVRIESVGGKSRILVGAV